MNFTGPEFLTFYIFLGVMGIALAAWLRFSLCLVSGNINQQPDLNTYEIAFLAGGNHRLIMAAITSLVKQGYVEVLKEGKLVVTGKIDAIADPVEKAVAQDILATDGAIKQVFQKSQGMKDSIRSRLKQLGLFLRDAQALKAQIYPSLIVVILLACIIHESRVKNPETTTRYKLQRLDLNNSLFCLSVTGLNERK
jgi:uncharacterized protein (TIGR04222 family)